MSTREDQHEVVKWYTRARRFPQLIGKTPDGARLWGGPYTYTQVIVAAVVIVVGIQTAGLWGQFGLIGNAPVSYTHLDVYKRQDRAGGGRLPAGRGGPSRAGRASPRRRSPARRRAGRRRGNPPASASTRSCVPAVAAGH